MKRNNRNYYIVHCENDNKTYIQLILLEYRIHPTACFYAIHVDWIIGKIVHNEIHHLMRLNCFIYLVI